MKKTTENADIKNGAATFPYPGILGLGTEWQKASAVGLEAWKRHVHTMLHAVDAIEQGSVKTRETQLGAAIEAHLTTAELENAVAGAKTPLDLWALQLNWTTGNFEKSLSYWRELFALASEANTRILSCCRDQMQDSAADLEKTILQFAKDASVPGTSPETAKAALDAVDDGFARMCEFSRQLLVASGGATAAQFNTTTGRPKH